jgi:phenylacetate-CoA ligase
VRHVDVVSGSEPVAKGEFGDLVVTDLIERKFPLIRYRLGDRGRLLRKSCECELPFPLMDYVKGRITDSIVTESGSLIPGEYWTTIFDDYTDEVKSFQVHQLSDRSVEVKYEPHKNADCTKVIAMVRDGLLDKLGDGARLTFEESEVDVNDNGKTRFVVSDVER